MGDIRFQDAPTKTISMSGTEFFGILDVPVAHVAVDETSGQELNMVIARCIQTPSAP